MTGINRRLRALTRKIGCPRHDVLLTCPTCQASEPLPPLLGGHIGRVITSIHQRVGPQGIAAALRWATPPVTDTCPRCQDRRVCGPCQEVYLKAVLGQLVLTDEEQARLEDLMATCRALESDDRSEASSGG